MKQKKTVHRTEQGRQQTEQLFNPILHVDVSDDNDDDGNDDDDNDVDDFKLYEQWLMYDNTCV